MKRIKYPLGIALIAVAFGMLQTTSCLADEAGASARPSVTPLQKAATDEIGGAGAPVTSSGTPAPNTKVRATSQQKAPANTLASQDAAFVKNIQMRILFQNKIGQLAQTSASSADVRKFGAMIISENTTAGNRLKTVAMSENIASPDKLNPQFQKRLDELSKLKGKQFDMAYVGQMIMSSERGLMAFKKARPKVRNEDLKTFIVETMPVVDKNCKAAKELEKSVAAE